jgi:hypothetical protein
MTRTGRNRCLAACGIVAAALAATGCGPARPPADPATARDAGAMAISVPFRNRWWHFYERGLAWADAGRDDLAEEDLRQVLALRRTDARLARTYGMHFVQCFARRELAAVLIRRGGLDEAERLLRDSMAQEPSAKAERLLQRIAELRAGMVGAPAPAAEPAPVPARIELATAPAGGQVAGRIAAPAGAVLWRVDDAATAAVVVPVAADGAFSVAPATGSVLVLGTANGPDPERTVAVPAAAVTTPEFTVDGPDAGERIPAAGAWYRWRAAATGGLAAIRVEDDLGTRLAEAVVTGDRAGGTLRVRPSAGRRTLVFTAVAADGASTRRTHEVEAATDPAQDRRLRAAALAIPLQAPRPGAMRPGDDARLTAALLDDGRFRLVDGRADGLLAAELALVEAGHVDRATAAAAGRRLASRYVIAGTMTRGAQDAECYLRLIHAGTGRVVATADAYAESAGDPAAEALFAAAAGRLRQAFPVVEGGVAAAGTGMVRFAAGSRQGASALMRVHVLPADGGAAIATLELVDIGAEEARARVESGRVDGPARGVSE